MRLEEIVRTSHEVADEASRRAKRRRLAACLRALGPDEAVLGVSLLCGALPEGRLGVGPAALRRARETPPAEGPRLALAEVGAALRALADASGPGSGRERARVLAGLFARATDAEQRFLARWLAGGLRQGASEGAMLDALADAADVPPRAVRRAAMLGGDLPVVGAAALRGGAAALASFRPTLFRPILPMLAQPARDVTDALARLGTAALEQKLDGARIQVHRRGDQVRVYSRRRHDVSAAVPEIAEAVRALAARELVLDGEAIALHPDGRPRPFQVTMRRFGRRADVARRREALPLSAFFFDCLWRDGESRIEDGARTRFEALAEVVPETLRVERRVTSHVAEAEDFLASVLERGHEGLVAKALDAPYEAGRRGGAWLKLKTAHTLDLVVLAAEWGSGRRRGWLSNLHLGARDDEGGAGFAMLGKTFKGLTDALLAWQTRELLAREVRREGPVVHVRPELVVEIAFSDVQTSPHHPCGLALRFARVRRYRPDKGPGEADPLSSVRSLRRGGSSRT